MSFDRIEHTTGLLYKIKFYIIYSKMLFLIDSFYLDQSLSFPTLFVSLTMLCVRLLSEPMILLSTHHVTNHLTCHNKLRCMSCNFILKIWKCNTRNIRKCNSASNYILIFGKLFYIYKLIHIHLKPRILIPSFLLAPLLNNNINVFIL